MKNNLFKNIIIIFCAFLLCGCASEENEQIPQDKIKDTINTNLEKIMSVSDVTSSNPYDYTQNEYFKNIIAIGKQALPVIEEMYENKELNSLNAYIAALAIQEIADCNLYEKYNIDWINADEFFANWKTKNCGLKN